jgi:hypothetical protein
MLLVGGAERNPVITGRILPEFVEALEKVPEDSTVEITSGGGSSYDAIIAAEIIESKRLHIIIRGECTSACVDYLLPAARSVVLLNSPIVALHGSTISDYSLLVEYGRRDFALCVKDNARRLWELWARNGVSPDVWRQTTDRLVPAYVSLYHDEACGTVRFHRSFWLPTESQLQAMFGERISGRTCVDDPECVARLARPREPGQAIVVGEEVPTEIQPPETLPIR